MFFTGGPLFCLIFCSTSLCLCSLLLLLIHSAPCFGRPCSHFCALVLFSRCSLLRLVRGCSCSALRFPLLLHFAFPSARLLHRFRLLCLSALLLHLRAFFPFALALSFLVVFFLFSCALLRGFFPVLLCSASSSSASSSAALLFFQALLCVFGSALRAAARIQARGQ